MTDAISAPPISIPRTMPRARIAPARRGRTPMMRWAPQPGQTDVPSERARAHDGQLKTCESVSPIARPFSLGFGDLGLASTTFEVIEYWVPPDRRIMRRGP